MDKTLYYMQKAIEQAEIAAAENRSSRRCGNCQK